MCPFRFSIPLEVCPLRIILNGNKSKISNRPRLGLSHEDNKEERKNARLLKYHPSPTYWHPLTASFSPSNLRWPKMRLS